MDETLTNLIFAAIRGYLPTCTVDNATPIADFSETTPVVDLGLKGDNLAIFMLDLAARLNLSVEQIEKLDFDLIKVVGDIIAQFKAQFKAAQESTVEKMRQIVLDIYVIPAIKALGHQLFEVTPDTTLAELNIRPADLRTMTAAIETNLTISWQQANQHQPKSIATTVGEFVEHFVTILCAA